MSSARNFDFADENPVDALSQQDLRVLLDNAPDAIARFDRKLRHVYANEATARANQRPLRDFIGKSMEDLGHPAEICDIINRHLRQVFASGKELTFELLFQSPVGPMWFQCRMAPESEGDLVKYVLVISRDITEQKRAEIALRMAEHRAAAAEIVTTLAHEINNPLAGAVNAIYLLGVNASLDAEGRKMVEHASSSLDRVTNISRRILSLYRDTNQ
jgi:nitrogen-specific signal transduction histidine kinase